MSHNENMPDQGSFHLNRDTARKVSMGALVAGLLGLLGAGVGLLSAGSREQALHSYLVAYVFIVTIALGGLFFAMLQHLVGAVWSVVVRRIAEIIASALPVLALLFVPIAMGVKTLFPWAGHAAHEHAVVAKAAYLNLPFFFTRAAFYFVTWVGLSLIFYNRSVAQDKSRDPFTLLTLRHVSAPAMFLFGITLTFAGFDWLMSLNAEWFSTIFGVYVFAGTVTSSLSAFILTGILLRRQGVLTEAFTIEHYHDLGKLLFGFIVFWTYIGFSQYFLIWYGNLPEETHWFLHRWEGGWKAYSVALVFIHFAIPFFGILSRNAKRSLTILGVVAPWMIAAHYIDLYWVVMPQLHKEGPVLSWLDVSCLLGVGGIFLAVVAHRLGSVPLVPVGDPRLQASMEFENA